MHVIIFLRCIDLRLLTEIRIIVSKNFEREETISPCATGFAALRKAEGDKNQAGEMAANRAKKKADASASKGGVEVFFKSRVGNGKALFLDPGVDGRSLPARRFREIAFEIAGDLGGMDELSEIQRQLVRRAAALSVLAETMEASIAKGEEVDAARFCTIINAAQRVSQALGLARVVLDVTPRDELRRLLDADDAEESEAAA